MYNGWFVYLLLSTWLHLLASCGPPPPPPPHPHPLLVSQQLRPAQRLASQLSTASLSLAAGRGPQSLIGSNTEAALWLVNQAAASDFKAFQASPGFGSADFVSSVNHYWIPYQLRSLLSEWHNRTVLLFYCSHLKVHRVPPLDSAMSRLHLRPRLEANQNSWLPWEPGPGTTPVKASPITARRIKASGMLKLI